MQIDICMKKSSVLFQSYFIAEYHMLERLSKTDFDCILPFLRNKTLNLIFAVVYCKLSNNEKAEKIYSSSKLLVESKMDLKYRKYINTVWQSFRKKLSIY